MTAPVRIEMIEKLIAKLLNPPIVRNSSCAYPSWCSSWMSCLMTSSRDRPCMGPPRIGPAGLPPDSTHPPGHVRFRPGPLGGPDRRSLWTLRDYTRAPGPDGSVFARLEDDPARAM